MPSSSSLQPREKNLLIGVAIVAVVVFLVQVVFVPQYEKMVAAEAKLSDVKKKASEIDKQIATRNSLRQRIDENIEGINTSSEKYFPSIIQEKVILFLNEETDKFDIYASYNFNAVKAMEIDAVFSPTKNSSFALSSMAQTYRKQHEPEAEEAQEDELVVYTPNANNKIDVAVVEISYEATYDNLIKLMSRLEEYPKKIIVTNLSVTVANTEGLLSGNITLEFYGLPKLNQQESDEGYLTWDIVKSYGRSNPFEQLSGVVNESIGF